LLILVVLSDHHPLEAMRTVLRRLSYLVIPLSIVPVKYFTELSRQYDAWTGLSMDSGSYDKQKHARFAMSALWALLSSGIR
jgi:hypothetical protein